MLVPSKTPRSQSQALDLAGGRPHQCGRDLPPTLLESATSAEISLEVSVKHTASTAGVLPTSRENRGRHRGEYLRKYQRQWMRDRRASFFAGKVCDGCGSTERLELHHREPSQKIAHNIWSWKAARREAEIAKCVVLCSGCHLELTRLDFAVRSLSAPANPGSSGFPNVIWYPQCSTWRVEFLVMGRRARIGGGGFRNIGTAHRVAESFRATLLKHYQSLNARSKIACQKQLKLDLIAS